MILIRRSEAPDNRLPLPSRERKTPWSGGSTAGVRVIVKIESSSTTGQSTGLNNKQDKKLKETCQDMESVFLSYLMKSMRETVQKSDLFGSSEGEDMFQSMMDDEICKSASRTSSTGIADMLYRQLSQDIEKQQSTAQEAQSDTAKSTK
jgi:peptidoglycan hydrolase FlgJ